MSTMFSEPVKKVPEVISIEDIEAGLTGMQINPPPLDEDTKYSNLDVEFEQKVKTQSIMMTDDDEDLFIITEDVEPPV